MILRITSNDTTVSLIDEQSGKKYIYEKESIYYPKNNNDGTLSIMNSLTDRPEIDSLPAFNWRNANGSVIATDPDPLINDNFVYFQLSLAFTPPAAPPPNNIGNLNDVNIDTPSLGHVLSYNAFNQTWENIPRLSASDFTSSTLTISGGNGTPISLEGGGKWSELNDNIYYINSSNLSAGKVGIGTSAPAEKLDVWGNAVIRGAINVNDQFTFPNVDGSTGQVLSTNGSGVVTWVDQSGGGVWTESGSDIYYNSGNVGIGTTSPTELLTIEGNNKIAFKGVDTGAPRDAYIFTNNSDNLFIQPDLGSGKSLTLGSSYWTITYNASSAQYDHNVHSFRNVNNQEFVRFDGIDKRVGIGTTSPSRTLSVNGDASFGQAFIIGEGSTQLHLGYGTSSSSKITTQRELINIIGGTASNGSGGSNYFTIQPMRNGGANFSAAGTDLNSDNLTLYYQANDPDSNYIGAIRRQSTGWFATNDHRMIGIGDSDYYNDSAGTVLWYTNNQTYHKGLLLSKTGNVGIGTTSPGTKLHVVGNSYVQGDMVVGPQANAAPISGYTLSIRDTVPSIYLKDQSGVVGDGRLHVENNIFSIGVDPDNVTTDAVLRFETRGSERMRIDHDGNVGIGTDSPDKQLTFYEGVTNEKVGLDSRGIYFSRTSDGSYTGTIVADTGGNPTYSARNKHNFSANSQQTLAIRENSNFASSGVVSVGPSDNISTSQNLFSVQGPVGIGSSIAYYRDNSTSNGLLVEGNVGIGTTTPSEKLDVDGNIKGTLLYQGTQPSANFTSVGISTSNQILAAGGVNLYNNVGVGHNPFVGFKSNGTNIQVWSSTNIANFGGVGGSTGTVFNLSGGFFNPPSGTSDKRYFTITPSIARGASYSGNVYGVYVQPSFNPADSGSGEFYSAYFGGGNVGIGTTTPSEKLHVDGDIKTTGKLIVGNSNLEIRESTAYSGIAIGNSNIPDTMLNGGGVAIGFEVGRFSSGLHSYAVAIGQQSMYRASSGQDAIGIGRESNSGDVAYSKSRSVAIGGSSGYNGSQDNVAVGHHTGANSSSTYTKSVFAGSYAGNSGGNNSVLVGYEAGKSDGVQLIDNTTAIGYQALTSLTTGERNTAVGYKAGYDQTTGANNTLIGYEAKTIGGLAWHGSVGIGQGVIAGTSSVTIGRSSKSNQETVTLGATAGNNTSTKSVFIGFQSGQNELTNNRLYIENSNSSTPLIYGEFDNDLVRINGDLQVTGDIDLSGGVTRNILVNGDQYVFQYASGGTVTNYGLYFNLTGVSFDFNNASATAVMSIGAATGDTEILGYVESKSIKVDDTGLSAAGDYGKSAEIWYQGTGATTAGSLYYLNSSGDWANTDASAASTAKGMLAFAAGTDSDVDGMITKGFVYLGTDPGGSVGDQVFLSETANAATTTAPSTSGAIVRVIGHKVATNVIYFNPSNDYFEVE